MTSRSPQLTDFLQSLQSAFDTRTTHGSVERELTGRIFQALRREVPASTTAPVRLPVCDCLTDAVIPSQGCTDDQSSAAEHARSLLALAPELAWWTRPVSDAHPAGFAQGHANATVIGKGGLEERSDVWIGITLMKPDVSYPEHCHPPEEVYLALSPGQWQQNGGAWHEPGFGGIVHNPPDALHAMRSTTAPLLATWCLWLG